MRSNSHLAINEQVFISRIVLVLKALEGSIALSLKLGAFDLIEDALRESPILLLDDVLSELDPFRRRRLLERVGGVQTLITCTDRSDLTDARPDAVLTVSRGAIS